MMSKAGGDVASQRNWWIIVTRYCSELYRAKIHPFYSSLNSPQQGILILTVALSIPYFLRGDFFNLLNLISATVKGQESNLIILVSLLTETLLIIYSSTLFINFLEGKKASNEKGSGDNYDGVHECIKFSAVPLHLNKPTKMPEPPSKFNQVRFKDEYDVSNDSKFNELYRKVASTSFSQDDISKFITNPFETSTPNLSGAQSEIYKQYNPESPKEDKREVRSMSVLEFMSQEEEKEKHN